MIAVFCWGGSERSSRWRSWRQSGRARRRGHLPIVRRPGSVLLVSTFWVRLLCRRRYEVLFVVACCGVVLLLLGLFCVVLRLLLSCRFALCLCWGLCLRCGDEGCLCSHAWVAVLLVRFEIICSDFGVLACDDVLYADMCVVQSVHVTYENGLVLQLGCVRFEHWGVSKLTEGVHFSHLGRCVEPFGVRRGLDALVVR